jgi:hypothetical protein
MPQFQHVVTSRLSRDIPPEIKIAIAEVVMSFAAMEGYGESLIWMLLGINYDDGILLTRMDARPKFELLREFYQRYVNDDHESKELKDFWRQIEIITQLRNKIVHGMWAMIDGKIPACASFRIKGAPSEQIASEAFPLDRLKGISEQCQKITASFQGTLDSIAKQRGERTPQPLPRLSNPLLEGAS